MNLFLFCKTSILISSWNPVVKISSVIKLIHNEQSFSCKYANHYTGSFPLLGGSVLNH